MERLETKYVARCLQKKVRSGLFPQADDEKWPASAGFLGIRLLYDDEEKRAYTAGRCIYIMVLSQGRTRDIG